MNTIPAQRPEPDPIEPQRPTGACTCPRADGFDSLRDCTCEWDELFSALLHIAYGATPDMIAAAGPAVAAMAHDLVYRARNAALRDLAGRWSGSRSAFAAQHGLSRAQLYNIL